MKTLLTSMMMVLCSAGAMGQVANAPAASDSTGLPGDHFNLQGAVELFKVAKDLESFEQSLNSEDQHVNNLDLDGDGQVDYVRVLDHVEGDAHAITMQVALGKEEVQDVAVIELEKNGAESAVLQIRGAEELYGTDVIVEPFEEKEEGPTMKGPAAPGEAPAVRIWVNVWAWPCVTWIYGPSYVVWSSPWYWGYYPPWWRPWRPWGWGSWYRWHRPYYGWYHHVNSCRVVRAHAVYQHRAAHSPAVRARTQAARSSRATMRATELKREQQRTQGAQRTRQPNAVRQPSRTRQPSQRTPSRSPSPRKTAPTRRGR